MLNISLLVEESIIVETLERIGIINKHDHIIFPSCYLYKENGEYFIAHFKELILIHNSKAFNNFDEIDELRRNSIAVLLEDWEMLDINTDEQYDTIFVNILPFNLKSDYEIVHKFKANHE